MALLRQTMSAARLSVLASLVIVGCAAPSGQEEPGVSRDELRICPSSTATVRGVDASTYQGVVDWARVHGAGYDFAFARVGDGAGVRDETFARNWDGMKRAGLVRGAYQLFRAGQDVAAQVANVTSAVGRLGPGDLPVVLDLETSNGQSAAAVIADALAWLRAVEAQTGKKPIVYTSVTFWDSIGSPGGFAGYPLWVANYRKSCPFLPDTWPSFRFWQYDDSGSVAGIAGPVDVDLWNGSLAELEAFAGGGGSSQQALATAAPSWARSGTSATYAFHAVVPASVERVDYTVDGFGIGSAQRSVSASFETIYTFGQTTNQRALEARGFDAAGVEVARGDAMIDVTQGAGVFIRPVAPSTYEIGLEGAPSTVAAIEVRADGFLLTDGLTGATRSERLAVRSPLTSKGPRQFEIRTFGVGGVLRGTLRRDFTLP